MLQWNIEVNNCENKTEQKKNRNKTAHKSRNVGQKIK